MKKIIAILSIAVFLVLMVSPVSAAKKDTKAPAISKTSPVDCATDVMIESTIVIRFNEAILKGKTVSKITLMESGSKSLGYTYKIKDNLLSLTPKEKLKYNTIYTVNLPASAVKDSTGNNFAKAYTLTFITEEDPATADTTQNQTGLKYILELEATFDKELTDTDVAYYAELLKLFGIDATFLDYYPVEKSLDKNASDTEESKDNSVYKSYVLLLKDPGKQQVAVIKAISDITGLSLSKAKELTDGAPVIIIKNITLEQAEKAQKQLEELKAVVSVIGIK